jgi:DNA-binding MarR family transcriptional regulator
VSQKATAKKPGNLIELADALHSTAIHLLRQVRTEDRACGIGPAQLSALSVLVFGGSTSLKKLAAMEQVKPPTMVRIVQALLDQKLVVTRADPNDARKLQISATARGRSLMQKARSRRVEKLACMLQSKTDAQRQQIANAVEILRNLNGHTTQGGTVDFRSQKR